MTTASSPAPAGQPASGNRSIHLKLVTSAGCHFCREADQLLDNLGQRFPLSIERIDLTSPEGVELARRFRVPFPPVLLIDGQYHAHGRISERKLTRALTRLVDGEE